MQFNDVAKNWLSNRKITEETQKIFNIHTIDDRIVIPILDADGVFLFNKYRRSPLVDYGAKYTYDKGGKVSLYAWHIAKNFKDILITEGEMDCLVAWSHNIPAITSTGGAMSFQEEWVELLKDKNITICFDNDEAGGNGALKVFDLIPTAKILFLPNQAHIKDISDYVTHGGDLHSLLTTAKTFKDISEVREDLKAKESLFAPTHFHNAYIREHTKVPPEKVKFKSLAPDAITRAKEYPMTNLIEFKSNKCICPFHSDRHPSFYYFPETNTAYCFSCNKLADSIEIYKHQNNCSFSKAVSELNKLQNETS